FRSVNFKFVPDNVFVSKEFASALLLLHLTLLLVFAHYRWSNYVCRQLHRHCVCSVFALPILFVVLLLFAFSSVEDTVSYSSTKSEPFQVKLKSES
ncbi:Dol-P-Man:Man(5)GlcNAc(2)-PP-Dol alpha-1,3-mannosyltransferase, partial [Ananas comosus]